MRMARFLIVPLMLLAMVGSAAAQAPAPASDREEFERLFARAMALHQAGDLLGAVDDYKRALVIDPSRGDALSNLGAAYVGLGQFDDAIRQYELALKSDPTAATVRFNLGLAYYKSGRPAEAIPQFRRVVASEPDAKNAYLILADAFLQTGEDAEVVRLLEPRAQMFGGDLAYAYLLGTALLHTGEADKGQRQIDTIFGAGESAEGHMLTAMAYLTRRDFPAAKDELKRAVELNPKLPTAHALYGRCLLALGEPVEAERAFRTELALNINDFESNLQLGHMRRSAQKFDEAQAYLQRAVTIRPKDVTARKLYASLQLQRGKNEEAAALFEALIEDEPGLIEAHVQLATAYNRLGRRDDAERERQIVDKLNAEAQAKQAGAGGQSDDAADGPAGSRKPGGGRR